MYDAIKKRGGVVDLKIYENEGHEFVRVDNQIDAYKRVADFLKAHVPPAIAALAQRVNKPFAESVAANRQGRELVSKILLRVKKGDPQGLKPAFLAALGGTAEALHPSGRNRAC